MKDTPTLTAPAAAATSGRPSLKTILKVAGVVVFLVACASGGAALGLLGKFYGTTRLDKILGTTALVLRDPRKSFPGQDRITVLCLGLDRNIYRGKSRKDPLNGMPYTKGARSDVMMIASLDLASRTVSVMSIPRDTRAMLPGRRSYSKINEAHARGGIPTTRQAVEEFLGIKLDYHVVIKQEAIQEVVKALGGIDLDVPMDMDYDDNWGQLHIHLKKGPNQRLDGQQVVGFMRYRHGDPEGDLGRIKRQQQVIQVLSHRVKEPRVLMKAGPLIEAIRTYVQTDLTPEQQIALAHLFHKVDTANIQTASLPVMSTDTIDGISYVIPDDYKKEAMVNWLLNGDREAMNRLITVRLKNASGDRQLYDKVYDCLRHYGFDVVSGGRADGEPTATRAVQHTNLRGAARRVLEVFGLTGDVVKDEGPSYDVTLYVGQDLESNSVVASSELWPETPQRPARSSYRRDTARSRRRGDSVLVRVRAAEGPSDEQAEEKEEPTEPSSSGEVTPASSGADEPAKATEPAPSGGGAPPTEKSASPTPGEGDREG